MTNTFTGRLVVLTCALQLAGTVPVFADYFSTGRVRPFSSQTRRVSVPAGVTSVIVRGNGDSEFDCWVYDRSNTVLGRDLRNGDVCEIEFQTPSSGELTVRINNYGDLANKYEFSVERSTTP